MNATETPAPAEKRLARILVVDDERSMRELLAIVLRREGYEVLLAESGRAAIETLEREPVDLLISDIKMPDVSGVDVLRAAKRIDQDILGIMITAFESTETAVEAMRLGACGYLSKPCDIDLLKKLRLNYAILDEARNIKNPLSAILSNVQYLVDGGGEGFGTAADRARYEVVLLDLGAALDRLERPAQGAGDGLAL